MISTLLCAVRYLHSVLNATNLNALDFKTYRIYCCSFYKIVQLNDLDLNTSVIYFSSFNWTIIEIYALKFKILNKYDSLNYYRAPTVQNKTEFLLDLIDNRRKIKANL